MRIDYMKLINYIRGLFKRQKVCPKNNGTHTLIIEGIVKDFKLIRVEVRCNQCDYRQTYK